ncbi:hypothetical protein FH972_003230 [Carpinus fangiana]|uniref:Major facilitator superfamily (MFS) profile domain-containing protein n=1 Tax=Carpinus fangiana TaxID=176857 RepID=A0A5N6QHU1_9ROSI|nr:hypothetical protein FH972_003230 [Carpinus fangiana]
MEISSEKMKSTQKVASKKGGVRTMPFIIANETFEKVASFGLIANMILYLINEYHMDTVTGFSVLFMWSAVSHFTPVIGAFLSDSYLDRFRMIAYGTAFTLLGLTLLWLTSVIPQARPPHCDPKKEKCLSPTTAQLGLLLSSFALMSIGAGGIRACSLAFGADQFNETDNLKKENILQSFFNWYYVSVGISIMLSVTVIVYIQDVAGWVVGFAVPVGLMLFSAVTFLLGTCLYIKVKANKSLFTGFAQVTMAAWKKKHLDLPPKISDGLYYHKGSNLTMPTDKIRYLNKACMIGNPMKDLDSNGMALDPWSLCTTTQVEELKALIKVIFIWSTGIMVAVTLNQQPISVLQASTMDRHIINKFKIPAASLGVFGILSMSVMAAVYDRIGVPLLSKFTKSGRGLSLKGRMGIGAALTCVATAVSAVVEGKRRSTAIREGFSNDPRAVVNMSAMWLVPQHCLQGIAEAFNAIGQIEFYYSQFPKSMSSIAIALFSLGMGVGNLIASLIVNVVDDVTKRGGNVSWVSKNLNMGHYDYYYWVLTILGVVNVFYYVLCSWAYGSEDDRVEGVKEEDVVPKSYNYPPDISI